VELAIRVFSNLLFKPSSFKLAPYNTFCFLPVVKELGSLHHKVVHSSHWLFSQSKQLARPYFFIPHSQTSDRGAETQRTNPAAPTYNVTHASPNIATHLQSSAITLRICPI
jgi:hypothetical protein